MYADVASELDKMKKAVLERQVNELKVENFATHMSETVELSSAHVQHTLLRMLADSVTNFLRNTVGFNKRASCKHVAAEKFPSLENKGRTKTVSRGEKNWKKAQAIASKADRLLKQTSMEIRAWRIDSQVIHRMVKSLAEVERGCLFPENDKCKIGNLTADSKNLYVFEDSSTHSSVYTSSLPIAIGINGVSVTPLLKEAQFVVQGVCHIDQVGQVVVLKTRRTSELFGTSQYRVMLRLINSQSQEFECDFGGNPEGLYLPFALKNGSLIIASHSDAILGHFRLHRVKDSSIFQLHEMRRLRLDKPLRSFSYNAECDLALAVYRNTAEIVSLDTKVIRRSTIYIDNEKNYFSSSAISSHPIFFIANTTSNAAVIQLFDIYGRELRRCAQNELQDRYVFDSLVNPNRDFVVCEDRTQELRLLYCESSTQRWHYIRLRCARRNFSRLLTKVTLLPSEGKSKKSLQESQSQECSSEKLCEFNFLTDATDFVATHNDTAFFILDARRNSVKRLPKDSIDSASVFTACQVSSLCAPSSSNQNIITSVGMLDQNSLVVLLSNCIIVHVCAASMCVLRSVRFCKNRLQLHNASAYLHATQAWRLFVTILGHDRIQQVHRSEGQSDWRLVKSHKFPNGWIVVHVNFDRCWRRFSLVLGKSFTLGRRRVSILDDEMNETSVLNLPIKSDSVSKVFLLRDLCFILLCDKCCEFYLLNVNTNDVLHNVNCENVLDILSFEFNSPDASSKLNIVAANQEAMHKITLSVLK